MNKINVKGLALDDLKGRKFKLWDYNVSHSWLLIRSPRNKSLGHEQNIDLLFGAVHHMELTKELDNISITEESYDHYYTKYVIDSEQGQYAVIAGLCNIRLSDKHIFDSPLDRILR